MRSSSKGRAADLTRSQRWTVVIAIGLLHLVAAGWLLRAGPTPESTPSRETALQVGWIALAEPVEVGSPSMPTPPQPMPRAVVRPLPTVRVPLLSTAELSPSQATATQPALSTAPPLVDDNPDRPAEAQPLAQSAASSFQAMANATATTAPPAAPPLPKNLPAESVQYLVAPAPVYPRLSRRQGETGRVLVRVYIDEAGLPRSVQLNASSGHGRLDDAALLAVQQARFKPYAENGRPTGGWALIPLTFDLEK
ncbi:MAG: TonB family protein [Burkholderiaceae bacterium]|nr:TonB family protein [Burkholderiaceae bacterium]